MLDIQLKAWYLEQNYSRIKMPNPTNPKSFGMLIRELREAKRLLLRQAAADLELDQSVLSKLENGLLFPNEQWLDKFAKYYKVTADELRALAYADRILNEYGEYKQIDQVLKLVRERLTDYQTQKSKDRKK